MPPRRIYPSWLPPNPREREALTRLQRRQVGVIAWLIALLPIGWTLLACTGSDVLLCSLTIFWIVIGVTLAQRITDTVCPRCNQRFSLRRELPYWYGLFNRRCESCGLTLEPLRDSDL